MNGKRAILPLLSILILAIAGCRPQIHTKAELRKYLYDKNNGLVQERQTPVGITMRLNYLPSSLLSQKVNAKDRYYFLLSLSKDGKELLRQLDFNTYSDLVRVLSFRMAPLISLIPDGKEAIQADDCFFQQTFGMTGSNELLIAFDTKKIGSTDRIKVRVNEFGLNLGDLDFDFASDDIQRITDISDKQLQ